MSWIIVLSGCLLVTCLLELGTAWIWKIRQKRAWLLVILVNIVTNPVANVLYWVGESYRLTEGWIWFLFLEGVVLFVEAGCYRMFREYFSRPLLFSLTANGLSALFGVAAALLV